MCVGLEGRVWRGVCGRKLSSYFVGVDFFFWHSWILVYLKELFESTFLLIFLKCGSVPHCLLTYHCKLPWWSWSSGALKLALFHLCRCRKGFTSDGKTGCLGLSLLPILSICQFNPKPGNWIGTSCANVSWKSDAVFGSLLSIPFD